MPPGNDGDSVAQMSHSGNDDTPFSGNRVWRSEGKHKEAQFAARVLVAFEPCRLKVPAGGQKVIFESCGRGT